eukprot:gene13498-biopygen12974
MKGLGTPTHFRAPQAAEAGQPPHAARTIEPNQAVRPAEPPGPTRAAPAPQAARGNRATPAALAAAGARRPVVLRAGRDAAHAAQPPVALGSAPGYTLSHVNLYTCRQTVDSTIELAQAVDSHI